MRVARHVGRRVVRHDGRVGGAPALDRLTSPPPPPRPPPRTRARDRARLASPRTPARLDRVKRPSVSRRRRRTPRRRGGWEATDPETGARAAAAHMRDTRGDAVSRRARLGSGGSRGTARASRPSTGARRASARSRSAPNPSASRVAWRSSRRVDGGNAVVGAASGWTSTVDESAARTNTTHGSVRDGRGSIVATSRSPLAWAGRWRSFSVPSGRGRWTWSPRRSRPACSRWATTSWWFKHYRVQALSKPATSSRRVRRAVRVDRARRGVSSTAVRYLIRTLF